MAKKSEGKKFEEDFIGSIPQDVWKHRLKDDFGMYKGVKNPSDTIMYTKGKMFLLELKSTQEKSLPYANIDAYQFQSLYEASKILGIVAGFIINFRSVNETYFLEIDKALLYMNTNSRKSFPLNFLQENAVLINCRRKRVRYHYYVEDLIKVYCK